MKKNGITTHCLYRDNLLALQVYYIQLNLYVIKQVGAYNVETLIGM